MTRDEAATFAVELLQAASEGRWRELWDVGLSNDTTELVRVLNSMDKEITRLEQREKELSDALITRLMPLDFKDGTEPEPATPATDPLAGLQIQQRRAS